MTLRERIEAELDRREEHTNALRSLPSFVDDVDRCTCYGGGPYGHEPGCGQEPGPAWWAITALLAGLAEDRDILKRHAPVEVNHFPGQKPICAYEWADGDAYVVSWELCPEVLSLARRHGIEPS